MSLYYAVFIPVQVGFGMSYGFLQANEFIEVLFNFILIVETILMFVTSYQDSFGNEVQNPYLIFKRYRRSARFKIDVMTILSFFKNSHMIFKVLEVFKVARIYITSKKISKNSLPIYYKELVHVFNIMMLMLFYIHWLGCFFNFIITYNSPKKFFVQLDGSFQSVEGEILPNITFNQV